MRQERGILDRSEVEKMLDRCPETFAGSRMRAQIAIMFRTGIRPGEMLGLNFGDVRRVNGRMLLRVDRPKGHAKIKHPSPPRDLLVDSRATLYYQQWMKHRGVHLGPLFCNRNGKRITSQYFGRSLKSIARRAGIEKRVHAHGIRHSFAHDFYYERKDLGELSGALGHRKVKTTLIYCQDIGCNPRVIEAMAEREW